MAGEAAARDANARSVTLHCATKIDPSRPKNDGTLNIVVSKDLAGLQSPWGDFNLVEGIPGRYTYHRVQTPSDIDTESTVVASFYPKMMELRVYWIDLKTSKRGSKFDFFCFPITNPFADLFKWFVGGATRLVYECFREACFGCCD